MRARARTCDVAGPRTELDCAGLGAGALAALAAWHALCLAAGASDSRIAGICRLKCRT